MPHGDKRKSRSPRRRSRSPKKHARRECNQDVVQTSKSGSKYNDDKPRENTHYGSSQHGRHHHHGHRHHHHGDSASNTSRDGLQSRGRGASGSSPLDPHRPIKQEPADDGKVAPAASKWESERDKNDHRRVENRRHRMQEPHPLRTHKDQEFEYGRPSHSGRPDAKPPAEKEKPNFGLSGKLTEDTNTFKGVVIKYNEPPEARKPKKRWRLYPFKGELGLPVLHLHRQSGYLCGRERKIADIPVDHPSCSKQHAVLQFRAVDYEKPDGTAGRRIRPYIIDLNSANGTFVNNQRIESQRYFELFEKDVIKFGFSTREYVLLHDSVDTSELNDEADGAE